MLIRINWSPNRKQLRNFGAVLLVFFALGGALLAWRFRTPALFYTLAAAGAVIQLVCVFLPAAGLLIYKAWMGLGFLMGFVTAPVLLGVVFVLVFTPIGLLLRLFGKDSMQRRRPPAGSLWREVKHRTDKASYERQF